tara:strand:- start:168 stop:416 length:249 start_codon:yes stop_codon:yes gene_type:complete
VGSQDSLGRGAPIGPGADVGVDVEEVVQLVREVALEASSERVVVDLLVSPVRDLDQEARVRVARSTGAAEDLDEGDALEGSG